VHIGLTLASVTGNPTDSKGLVMIGLYRDGDSEQSDELATGKLPKMLADAQVARS
jgi:hypothetical protein